MEVQESNILIKNNKTQRGGNFNPLFLEITLFRGIFTEKLKSMKNFKHLMLDMETMGTKPCCELWKFLNKM